MDWELLRTIATVVLGIATVLAATVVGLLVGSMRTIRDSNNDLRLRVTDLEKERAADKAALSAKAAELASTNSENVLLKTMITGKVEWVALTDQLEEHHRQALASWTEMRGLLGQIVTALEAHE